MSKFIIGSFLVLGWGFYEMSGGADFAPQTASAPQIAAVAEKPRVVPFDQPQVTRAAVIEIPTAAEEAEVVQASLEVAPEATLIQETQIDRRAVVGKWVNMRSGPGTSYDVLDTLAQGTETEVIEVNASGWARVRVIESNQIGWMAERLLSEI